MSVEYVKKKKDTLEHYLRECPIIGKYRGKNEIVGTLECEAERFLNVELLGEKFLRIIQDL